MKLNLFQLNKIKGKLLLAFSAVLFLSSVLAGWGYYSINKVLEINSVGEQFKDINTIVLKMRKSEKDFLMRDVSNLEFMSTGKSKYLKDIQLSLHMEDSLISSLKDNTWSTKLGINEDL